MALGRQGVQQLSRSDKCDKCVAASERSWGVAACPEETGDISACVWVLIRRDAAPTWVVGSQVTSVDVPVMRFFILPLFLLSEGSGLKINTGA